MPQLQHNNPPLLSSSRHHIAATICGFFKCSATDNKLQQKNAKCKIITDAVDCQCRRVCVCVCVYLYLNLYLRICEIVSVLHSSLWGMQANLLRQRKTMSGNNQPTCRCMPPTQTHTCTINLSTEWVISSSTYRYAGSISSCLPFAHITNGSGVSTRPFTTKPTQIRRGNAVANCRKKQVKEREIK